MKLVGREVELAVLAGATADVRGGRSRVLGAIGEAGIGKTELLGALAAQARDAGLLVLEGRCAEHERDVPFGVVIDALDDHVATLAPRRVEAVGPGLAAVLPAAAAVGGAGAAERFRHHRALCGLLEMLARERPVALLLDDLHWADEASFEFVLHLLRRPPRAACLLLFALRPGDRAARLLAAARATRGWEHLPLGPLSDQAARSLLAELPDAALRERVVADAAGNPLFLRELGRLARRGETALPPTLTAAVGLDVAALEPRARALIEGAAVVGDPFDPELAAAAAGLEPDAPALDRLVVAELIRPVPHPPGRSFAFRHPLVRRAVYEGVAPAWRLGAHERVATALERRGAAAAARAYHVERFAPPGDAAAIAVLAEAAATAADTAPAIAARWYAAAAERMPEDDPQRLCELLVAMARALANAGRLAESRDALVRSLGLLGSRATPLRLTVLTECAAIDQLLGRHADARRRLRAALREAPSEHHAALSVELASAALYASDAAALREWAARAAKSEPEPALLAGAEALAALGALWVGEPEETALDRAAVRLDELDDADLAIHARAAVWLASAELHAERFAQASATAARGERVARGSRQARWLPSLALVRSLACFQLLELAEARDQIETAEESIRLQGLANRLHWALWTSALIHDARGEAGEAQRAADECSVLERALEPSHLTRAGTAHLAAIRFAHDPERCVHELLAAGGPSFDDVGPTWRSALGLALVRAALAAGRSEDAGRWAGQVAGAAARLRLPASAARGACARAEVLLARGDAAGAAALAQAAAAVAESVPAPLDATDARLLAGRALAAAAESDEAKVVLQQVAADAGRGGALRLRDAAARELRRLGTRVSAASRRAAPDPLSARERDIAELVADGHPNKQIAATLFISEKTVRNALTRVYAKLGVRSRSQLTRALTSR